MPDRHAQPGAAIGACIQCRTLFLVTPDRYTCPFCSNPPAETLPFPVAGAGPPSALQLHSADVPAPAAPLSLAAACPHCAGSFRLDVWGHGVMVVPTYAQRTGAPATAGNGAAPAEPGAPCGEEAGGE